ncbi:MAG: C25 family cysteine peptidase [Promethearchaeota archaeon]
MKALPYTKWFCVPLLLLLLLSYFQPLSLLASSTIQYMPNDVKSQPSTRFNKFRPIVHSGPRVLQPAGPEYLIITPNSAWVQPFADWKNRTGVLTRVANVTWIVNNIPLTPGTIRDKAEQIWTYINQVYTATLIPTLHWVLLIGDNSTIPSRYIYSPDTTEWDTPWSDTFKPTDFYYCVMDDPDWNDDDDGLWGECSTFNIGGPATDEIGDWDPDLYVGRIPFSDQTNITTILSQTITYARNPTSFSTTGWDTFLLAGAISNYDEEAWTWLDGDWTDEAELSDYIDDNILPPYYNAYRFYENRNYFWNYTPTNLYQDLNDTAVISGIDLFSPALINFAGHGNPLDIQRKYDTFYPYGQPFSQLAQGNLLNVSGIAIGDPDNDGTNEIVYTHANRPGSTGIGNGTVWIQHDLTMTTGPNLVWNLWNAPPWPLSPCWATCVDIGDVWNNGTHAIVVGTNVGAVIIFTWHSLRWTAAVLPNYELDDPILCIEVGNADNALEPWPEGGSGIEWNNTDIAWGHQSGWVKIGTCFGAIGLPWAGMFVQPVWQAPGAAPWQAVYSIDVGNPNDDRWGEITIGTGYVLGNRDGDCYMLQFIPSGPWNSFTVDTNLGEYVYGLDTGMAGNDGFNKTVVGLGDGAIYMYESNKFVGGTDAGTKTTVTGPSAVTGIVRCLRVGYVDENDVYPTLPVERVSIIAGNQWGGIRKYHAQNITGLLDWYPLQLETPLNGGPMVTALDVGELSYNTGEQPLNIEVAAGTDPNTGAIPPVPWATVVWYEWPYVHWNNMINTTQADASTAIIPALIYADSCHTGAYDYPSGCLAASFLRDMAIGYIGSMRVCWYYHGPMSNSFSWGLSRYMDQAFWELFFNGSTNYRPGATLYESKVDYISNFSTAVTPTIWETWHRKNLLMYALFGDPELDVYTDNPEMLTVTYPSSFPYGQSVSILVADSGGTPIQGARVCLRDPAGSYYEMAMTDASGIAVFNLTTAAGTLLDVTATAHNYSPHEGNLTVNQWITITGTTLNYNATNFVLEITGVIAFCPTHGVLTDATAVTHTYTLYLGTTNVTSGQLNWDTGSSTWQRSIDTAGLTEGTYIVRCYFTDTDGTGWADSTTFIIEHYITIGTPSISYDSTLNLLDITGVIALCSYTDHEFLDDTEATIHSYTVFDNATDTATSLTGDLTWTGTQWQVLDVDVSTLPAGSYYVRCTFADSDVSATQSPESRTFTITPPDILYLLLGSPFMFAVLVSVIVIMSIIIFYLVLRLRRIKS